MLTLDTDALGTTAEQIVQRLKDWEVVVAPAAEPGGHYLTHTPAGL